jgi:hypothetical protein
VKQFDSIEDLWDYLFSLPENTPETAYEAKLSIGDTDDFIELYDMIYDAKKYVSLDLSGSALTEIPNAAFYNIEIDWGNPYLIGVTLPNSVASIGEATFCGCDNLIGITIPDNVTSIGERAFSHCTDLASITIPNNVTSIGEGAFAHCTGLASITIPNNVTSIGQGAFTYCDGLTSVTFLGAIASDNFGTFYGIWYSPFDGDLRDKYLAEGIGTYTRENGESKKWTKK